MVARGDEGALLCEGCWLERGKWEMGEERSGKVGWAGVGEVVVVVLLVRRQII